MICVKLAHKRDGEVLVSHSSIISIWSFDTVSKENKKVALGINKQASLRKLNNRTKVKVHEFILFFLVG